MLLKKSRGGMNEKTKRLPLCPSLFFIVLCLAYLLSCLWHVIEEPFGSVAKGPYYADSGLLLDLTHL
jgi:hypothetical protein